MIINEELLQNIRAHPDQDEPRLAYADWLDGKGSTVRAELIRIQCQLAKSSGEEAALLADREQVLLKDQKNWATLTKSILPPEIVKGRPAGLAGIFAREFRRGFVHSVELWIQELLELSDWVFRLEPMIQEVALGLVIPDEHGDYSDNEMSSNYGPYMEKLAHCANLKKVTGLEGHESKLGPSGMESLAQLPNLTAAKRLYLFEDVIGERGVKAIAESPSLLRLEELELNGCLVDWPDDMEEDPRTVPAMCAIAKAPTMAYLNILDLSFNSIGESSLTRRITIPK